MEIAPRISVDEKIRFGKPVIRGTHVPVELIIGKLAGGISYEEVIAEYEITREDILAVLSYAAEILANEEIPKDSEKLKMMNREKIFEKIAQSLKNQGARKIAVFGSYIRGEEKPESDIDVIVEFSERKSLLEFVRIERELSELLGIKVDLLTEKSISPYLIDTISKEMEVIYE